MSPMRLLEFVWRGARAASPLSPSGLLLCQELCQGFVVGLCTLICWVGRANRHTLGDIAGEHGGLGLDSFQTVTHLLD